MHSPLPRLLREFSFQELRYHPWRTAAALVAVMLGVALAFSVHLINASALHEFAQAIRTAGGQPDLELHVATDGDGTLYGRLLHHPDVAVASAVLEFSTYALGDPPGTQRQLLRIVGVDALQAAALSPDLVPVPDAQHTRTVLFAPDAVFLNAAARTMLPGATLRLQVGQQLKPLQVAGSVRAAGGPWAVMDIAAAQDLLGQPGALSRIDIRLQAGVDRAAFVQALRSAPGWPAGAWLAEPGDATQRIGTLSRAYRVNLTVLALVALFTGGFLVFSVLALSVSRRAPQFALLGVLGLTGPQRRHLVLLEATAIGVVGSGLGLALGTALAALGLRLLGGDLGGGFFPGAAPALQWDLPAAMVFGLLGVAAALAGAWWPAQTAQRLPPAHTLKGLGAGLAQHPPPRTGLGLVVAGVLLALLPPVWGISLAAYASVVLLLAGGITALPWLVGAVLDPMAPWVAHRALPMLAVERTRRMRESASVAVSGVVASLSLAVALTVMVASFRSSVTQWLDSVLPADLYLRSASSARASDTVFFDPAFVRAAAQVPGVVRLTTQRSLPLMLDPAKPPVTLMARTLHDPATGAVMLPLTQAALAVPEGQIGVYVSEAMVDLYGAKPGTVLHQLAAAPWAANTGGAAPHATFFVAGVWRDYARQFGTIAMDQADFQRLGQDDRVNDIAFWLSPEADLPAVQDGLRAVAKALAATPGAEAASLLEFGSAQEIRSASLKVFDRSFAVTYWLQAVAIGIGLFGVASAFSAQVLARRKEFGLLAHQGLTRRQVLQVVAGEGLAWTTLGAVAGLALGLAVAVVLVHVVNPQSFHWTMELSIPWLRLLGLGGAVVLTGTFTAWLSGRAAASHDAVLAVKEDW